MSWRDRFVRLKGHALSDSGRSGMFGLFHKGLALVYLSALIPLFHQLLTLIGNNGLLPASELVGMVRADIGHVRAFLMFPSLFHFAPSDITLLLLIAAGCAGALMMLTSRWLFYGAVIAWASFLSITTIGGDFFIIIIDLFLSEVGFLSMFSAFCLRYHGHVPRVVAWPLLLLNFRLWFCMGVNKFYMPHEVWTDFTFFDYFFQAQPMPTPLAWHLHHSPDLWKHLAQVCLFIGEVIVPFFVFGPKWWRWTAFAVFVAISLLIQLSGNYGYFNLLSVVLALTVLKDADLPASVRSSVSVRSGNGLGTTGGAMLGLQMAFQLMYCVTVFDPRPYSPQNHLNHTLVNLKAGNTVAEGMLEVLRLPSYWRIVSPYGVFKGIPMYHAEIRFSGSADGEQWQAYRFRHLPSTSTDRLGFYAPYYPRLDHLMFYEGLCEGVYLHNPLNPYHHEGNAWICRFVGKLFDSDPGVTQLLLDDPFASTAPRYVKAELYRLWFAAPGEGGRWEGERMGSEAVWSAQEAIVPCGCIFSYEEAMCVVFDL